MECRECPYSSIERFGEDDFEMVCDPPGNVCPFNILDPENIYCIIEKDKEGGDAGKD